jgi:hypothetical protein
MDGGGVFALGEQETGKRVGEPAVERDWGLQNGRDGGAHAKGAEQGDEGEYAQKGILKEKSKTFFKITKKLLVVPGF